MGRAAHHHEYVVGYIATPLAVPPMVGLPVRLSDAASGSGISWEQTCPRHSCHMMARADADDGDAKKVETREETHEGKCFLASKMRRWRKKKNLFHFQRPSSPIYPYYP